MPYPRRSFFELGAAKPFSDTIVPMLWRRFGQVDFLPIQHFFSEYRIHSVFNPQNCKNPILYLDTRERPRFGQVESKFGHLAKSQDQAHPKPLKSPRSAPRRGRFGQCPKPVSQPQKISFFQSEWRLFFCLFFNEKHARLCLKNKEKNSDSKRSLPVPGRHG